MKRYLHYKKVLEEIRYDSLRCPSIHNVLRCETREPERIEKILVNSFSIMSSWMNGVLSETQDREFLGRTAHVLLELAKNAYRFGPVEHPGSICTLSCCIGERGVLVGTRQEEGFMSDEQISLLKKGKPVPTTVPTGSGLPFGGGNWGTGIVIENADGLWIDRYAHVICASLLYPRK